MTLDKSLSPIPIFYNPKQSIVTDSYSPSASKPAKVVADFQRHFGDQVEVVASTKAPLDVLYAAHDRAYVDGIMAGTERNGFGDFDAKVAQSFPYTTGSLLSAAKHVLEGKTADNSIRVACSPTSGFHHAHHARAEGFCTFNGLIAVAMKLKAMKLVDRVGILDMDQHYGNGTDDIIDKLGLDWITHVTAGKHYQRDPELVQELGMAVKMWFGRHPRPDGTVAHRFVDLILYQAGADAHVNDPLGGWLTTEQMMKRDFQVFRTCHQYQIPLVWNLAGGYQRDERGGIEPVLQLHRNTMQACIDIHHGDQG